MCILSGDGGHTSQTLSRPEKRQGQESVSERGLKKNSPSIKSYKSKSASSTAAWGDERWEEQAEDGMNRRVKRNGYKLTECLLAAVLSQLQSLNTLICVDFRW